jgi:hypothetical protein
MATSQRGGPSSYLGQSMWDLCWTELYWDFFLQVLRVSPVSIIPLWLSIVDCRVIVVMG